MPFQERKNKKAKKSDITDIRTYILVNKRFHKRKFKKCLKDIPIMASGMMTIKLMNSNPEDFYKWIEQE